METIFHGHSFVEILTDNMCVFIDPFIEGNNQCDLSVQQCIDKKPDAIIVTHGHDDHIGSTVEISKKTGCQIITSFELGKYFSEIHGCQNISLHGVGGGVDYNGWYVKFFQARHGGGISSLSHGYSTVACGILLQIEGKTIYHAGDTGLFSDMKLLNEFYNVDVAFLPIGDRYTMGVDDAIIATHRISPMYVVPIHYNTRDPIKSDDMKFAREVMLNNYATPKVLRPGQSIVL